MLLKEMKLHNQGCRQKNFQGGRGQRKKPKKYQNRLKNNTIKPHPGGRAREKIPKIVKKHRKISLLSPLYYICNMYENPGGPRLLLPLASDAHAYNILFVLDGCFS